MWQRNAPVSCATAPTAKRDYPAKTSAALIVALIFTAAITLCLGITIVRIMADLRRREIFMDWAAVW